MNTASMQEIETLLNWLSSYPGGCAARAYEQARAALAKAAS